MDVAFPFFKYVFINHSKTEQNMTDTVPSSLKYIYDRQRFNYFADKTNIILVLDIGYLTKCGKQVIQNKLELFVILIE